MSPDQEATRETARQLEEMDRLISRLSDESASLFAAANRITQEEPKNKESVAGAGQYQEPQNLVQELSMRLMRLQTIADELVSSREQIDRAV